MKRDPRIAIFTEKVASAEKHSAELRARYDLSQNSRDWEGYIQSLRVIEPLDATLKSLLSAENERRVDRTIFRLGLTFVIVFFAAWWLLSWVLPDSMLIGFEVAAAYVFVVAIVIPAFARILDGVIQTRVQSELRRRGI